MNFVEVALSTPIRSTFTYKNESNSCLVGKRVIVEFGRRKLLGVVVAESVLVNTDLKLKKIQEVLSWPATSEQIKAASKLVPDDVVQRCTASGTPEEAKTKVQEYIDAGCTSPILYPLGPDVQLMIDTFSEWE